LRTWSTMMSMGKLKWLNVIFSFMLGRTFLTLPDVLFINLKRYEWNK
jgi:hypothetical protein